MPSDIRDLQNQILALEIRPRFTGFVVLQPPSRLLDFGMRKHSASEDELPRIAAKKMSALLDLHQPSLIVVRTRKVLAAGARRKVDAILRVVRREARKRSIRLHAIRASCTRDLFLSHQCTSKDQRAALIARKFPELSWKLPPKRKKWKSEDRRMAVFDAAATVLAFMNRSPPTDR
jgi:hypothetical protein